MKRIQAITAAALMLGACTSTETIFTPPETAEGKACVERCQASQTSCRRDQDRRAERDKVTCETEAEKREQQCKVKAPFEYAACLKFAKNDEERAACELDDCNQDACYASSNYGLCSGDFRVCYQNCGGKISIIER